MELTFNLLSEADQQLFLWLNGVHSPVTDFLFYWITYKYTWVPMYLFLFYVVLKAYGKRGGILLAVSVVAVILADYITSGMMKPGFERFRPCHDPFIGHLVHNTVGCGGKFGFASSHASTAFALATSIYLFTKDRLAIGKWLFVWAFVYAYSRVAVGVHYPGDILVGALTGIFTGGGLVLLSNKFIIRLV